MHPVNIQFPIDSEDEFERAESEDEAKPFAYGKLKIADITRKQEYRRLFEKTGGQELASMEKEQRRIDEQ